MFARFRNENALMSAVSSAPDSGLAGACLNDEGGQRTFSRLRLRDGRALAWAEYGHRHGYPVLYMHRQGGCRLEAQFLHTAARTAGFRLLAVDRPGLGGSDFVAYEHPDELVDDYIELLNYLGLSKVAVFSWGAGSNFALAMAARCPERVVFLNLLAPGDNSSGFSPGRIWATPANLILRALLALRTWRTAGNGARYLERWREQMCYADRKQMEEPEVESILSDIARESTAQGVSGLAQDIWYSLAIKPYLCRAAVIKKIRMPVHAWHGSADFREGQDCMSAADDRLSHRRSLKVVVRHPVRRQGYLFFRHIAGDIFRIARQEIGVSPVAVGPKRR